MFRYILRKGQGETFHINLGLKYNLLATITTVSPHNGSSARLAKRKSK